VHSQERDQVVRIAFLSWESHHSITIGGVGTHVTGLAAMLARKGHEVHVFTRKAPGQRGHDLVENVHYHRCTYAAHHDFVDDINNMCRAFVDRVFEVEDFIGHFNIVHAHDWLAANAMIWIKQGRGHKCLLTIHSTEYARCGNAFHGGRSQRISDQERAGIYWADRVIAVSGVTKKEIMQIYGAPDSKISVIYNGVVPQLFDLTTDTGLDKRRYNIGPLDPTVLFCGRLAWQKGPDLLIEAIPSILRSNANAKFIFVGDGDMRGGLESRARQLGVANAVRFLGYRNGEELIHLFKLADVVCVPSRNEPFGIVVIEAWSAHKPVVVTQIGGPAEYVEHEINGLKIYPKPDSIVWGVSMMFSDFDRARRMGHNGRKAVEERFTWDIIVEQTLAVYHEICPEVVLPVQSSKHGTAIMPKEYLSATARNSLSDQEPVMVFNEAGQQGSDIEVQAKLCFNATALAGGARSLLAVCKYSLAQSDLDPHQQGSTLIIRGDLEKILSALKLCNRHMDRLGSGRKPQSCNNMEAIPEAALTSQLVIANSI
jgi:glycosyltransferase involved in cell wall biosynthesis